MAETAMQIILGAMLLICGIQDARKKKISVWIIAAGTILVGGCLPFIHHILLIDRIGGVAVGVLIIMTSLITGGKIGLGDGILLCVTGLGLGFWGNLELFAIALLLAAIVSIGLLILRLADRKKSIPFVPFMLLGYVFLIVANANTGM
ncbi:MAG TPA: prepilin peptidase [Mobilitalea sp.]|nr:prepilin peptidase [Mobilitalea sp.]